MKLSKLIQNTSLIMAVDKKNIDMINLLLKQPDIDINKIVNKSKISYIV